MTHATPSARRDALISSHVEIARRISLRVARRCPDWIGREDLVAAGMLGLIEAADRYDASRAEPFLPFAEKRIRGAVLDELRRGDILPRRGRQLARKVGSTIDALERTTGARPDDEAVAKALDVPVAEYRTDLKHLVNVAIDVLDETGDHPGALRSPASSPEHEAGHREALRRVSEVLPRLAQRDLLVMSLYYVDELTYAEIARVLGVTTARVCQLHGRAVAQLRTALGEAA